LLVHSTAQSQPNLRFAISDLRFKIESLRITTALTTLATQRASYI
jgi:hypothetical protein